MIAPTRVFITDDHAILRAGLRLLIDSQPDLEVVGEAEDGSQVMPRVRELAPDVVLLDLNMPEVDGLTVLRELRASLPDVHVLILTMHDDVNYLQQALQLGASGYVLKRAVDTEVLTAIRAVQRGETYVHSAMTGKLLQGVMTPPGDETPPDDNPWKGLSEREYDVLRLVALGYTNAEIASELFLSVKTVETYRARGMEKLDLQTRAQLVQSALQHGVMD
jgi:DNA-binding NarL/FixJ family response regulator